MLVFGMRNLNKNEIKSVNGGLSIVQPVFYILGCLLGVSGSLAGSLALMYSRSKPLDISSWRNESS